MKRIWILYATIICFAIIIFALNMKRGNVVCDNLVTDTPLLDSTEIIRECEYQYFNECGFAVKTPCLLEDVSQQVSGDFFLNYGGIANKDNPNKITFYQVIVNRLPIGYKNLSKNELDNLVDGLMKKEINRFSNSKPIKFSYSEYPGYAMECTTKGYGQKGVMFWKDNFIICLTVMTNEDLNEKFNAFTNSFKEIKVTQANAPTLHNNSIQSLDEIGYSLNIPCDLRKAKMQGYDVYYDGAINGESQDKAIVYKIMANRLPMPYSKMNTYDKNTIKQNLINYLQLKKMYKKWKAPIDSHMSYIADSDEQGFRIKEALFLTDDMVIELVMFSKLDIESKFGDFINSIKPIQ